ncbi:MAG: hypothetical protein ABSE82_11260 [Nitrososphaerales archaeon]
MDERTMYVIVRALTKMDATVKKIVEKYQDIQRQIRVLTREAESIKQTLALIGYRPEYLANLFGDGILNEDEKYAETLPFKHSSLVDACKQVLKDHPLNWLSKTQVEYLVTMGGYEFATENSKNSVDVTLRRLGSDGLCQVENNPQGNKYKWTNKPEDKIVKTE